MANATTPDIERVFRRESGRAVASLVRFFGDIDLAEEAVQEAFAVALRRWPATGQPPSPAGWGLATWVPFDTRSVGTTDVRLTGLGASGAPAPFVGVSGEVRVQVSNRAATEVISQTDLLRLVHER